MKKFESLQEIQLTHGNKGHFLNQRQVFSPNDKWVVFDTRNDGTQIIKNGGIAMVNVETQEIRQIYQAPNQTEYGPGVGAVVFNPKKEEVAFIHGLLNADSINPYDFTRRTAFAINPFKVEKSIRLDARDIIPPFTAGALRGGTHAHAFSGDGEWVSFTYNDFIMQQLAKVDSTVQDLRTVGVMLPQASVEVDQKDEFENFGGKMFSAIAATVTEFPDPGSNEINKAYEEGWIGENGYINEKGQRQEKALAFQGDIVDEKGNTLTEVFIVDLPKEISVDQKQVNLSGTKETRPEQPLEVHQRRLTFTQDLTYPGVQGPRQWLTSLPDGSLVFFPRKDKDGIVQIFAISPNGDSLEQITYNDFPLETSFSIDPSGNYVAYGCNQEIYISEIRTGNTKKVIIKKKYNSAELSNINWSNDGKILVYNRKLKDKDGAFYQIFALKSQKPK